MGRGADNALPDTLRSQQRSCGAGPLGEGREHC